MLLPTRFLSVEVALLCGSGQEMASAGGMARQVHRKLSAPSSFQTSRPRKLLPRSTITQFGKGFGVRGWWLNGIHGKVGIEMQVLRLCSDTVSMPG